MGDQQLTSFACFETCCFFCEWHDATVIACFFNVSPIERLSFRHIFFRNANTPSHCGNLQTYRDCPVVTYLVALTLDASFHWSDSFLSMWTYGGCSWSVALISSRYSNTSFESLMLSSAWYDYELLSCSGLSCIFQNVLFVKSYVHSRSYDCSLLNIYPI